MQKVDFLKNGRKNELNCKKMLDFQALVWYNLSATEEVANIITHIPLISGRCRFTTAILETIAGWR
ncbi:MAG: hypothetical protein E7545_00780 [Ruminococcaceae bacterium]|nr:hypothetical protein [Oscillospiraceae bacterium]